MSRAGFTWLKQEDAAVYKDWRKFLSHCIDHYDWGYLHQNGISKPRANTKASLNYWLGGDQQGQVQQRRPYALSLARLQAATETQEPAGTVYVCSHPHSRRGFCMVDVDDKEGTYGDAPETCQYVNDLLTTAGVISGGSLYMQPSTFGYGYHGYAHLVYPDLQPSDMRDLMNRLQDWLRQQVHAAGYQSEVEVKGQPPIVSGGIYRTCGQLAKFPRLGQDLSLYRLFLYQTPALSVGNLWSVITNSYRGGRERRESQPARHPTAPVRQSVITNSYRGEREEERGNSRRINTAAATGGTDGVLASVPAPEQQYSAARVSNPATRMAMLATAYSRQLGRPATADEIIAEYERQNLHTGEDSDGNRRRLAEVNANWVAATWNQCLATGKCFNAADYSQMISQYVTPAIRETGNTRYSYDDTDLAICIYTVEANSRHTDRRQHGCPVAAFVTMAQTLGKDWGKPNTARMRVARIKQVLLAAELIRVIDDTYRFTGNGTGRGKKYGLGRNHPDYVE